MKTRYLIENKAKLEISEEEYAKYSEVLKSMGYQEFNILKLPVYNVEVYYLDGHFARIIFSDGNGIYNYTTRGNMVIHTRECELVYISKGNSYCFVAELEYKKSRFHKSEIVRDLLDIYFNPLSEW